MLKLNILKVRCLKENFNRIIQKEYVEPQLDDYCDIYLRKHLTNRAKIEMEHRLNQLEKLLRVNNFLMGNKGIEKKYFVSLTKL